MAALRAFLPPQAGVRNPVDMIASASPADFARAVASVGADPNVDAVVAVYVPPLVTRPEEVAAAIADGAGRGAAAQAGADRVPLVQGRAGRAGLGAARPAALLQLPRERRPRPGRRRAVRPLAEPARAGRCTTWRRRSARAVRDVVERALGGRAPERSASGWSRRRVEAVLRAAGIATAPSRVVPAGQAGAVAAEMGFPLVAKAVAPGLLHKSDVGGVVLGLDSADQVARAVGCAARAHARGRPRASRTCCSSARCRGGIEALVGVVADPTFGPLLVCGLGGVQVELLRDAAFRLPPVTRPRRRRR